MKKITIMEHHKVTAKLKTFKEINFFKTLDEETKRELVDTLSDFGKEEFRSEFLKLYHASNPKLQEKAEEAKAKLREKSEEAKAKLREKSEEAKAKLREKSEEAKVKSEIKTEKFNSKLGIDNPSDVTQKAIKKQNLETHTSKALNLLGMATLNLQTQATMTFYNAQMKQNFIVIAQNDEIVKQNNKLIEQNETMIELMKQMTNK